MGDITFAVAAKKKNKKLICTYTDLKGNTCGKTFVGYPNSKYCKYHRNAKHREVAKKEIILDITTFKFKHTYETPTEIIRHCDLEGCDNEYKMTLYPEQVEYARYCEHHRNPYKRGRHLAKLEEKKNESV